MVREKLDIRAMLLTAVSLMLAGSPLLANDVEVTGTLGSPSATTTISGKQLPAPEPKFGGVIKEDALNSKTWWAPRIVPPAVASSRPRLWTV